MLDNGGFAFLKTLNCRNNTLPTRAPERFILIDMRQQVFDFRQYQFIRARIIVNFLTREESREWRAVVVIRTRLIRTLYRDTHTNTIIARIFGKISGFGS